jgi:hypothetical protein
VIFPSFFEHERLNGVSRLLMKTLIVLWQMLHDHLTKLRGLYHYCLYCGFQVCSKLGLIPLDFDLFLYILLGVEAAQLLHLGLETRSIITLSIGFCQHTSAYGK